MSYLYQEIIYSFLSEIAAAFVLHQLEVWDYNYKQIYLCILPPPTFSPSLNCRPAIVSGWSWSAMGVMADGQEELRLTSPDPAEVKVQGRALGCLTKNTMLL